MCRHMLNGHEHNHIDIEIMLKPHMLPNSSGHEVFKNGSGMVFYMFKEGAFRFTYIKTST